MSNFAHGDRIRVINPDSALFGREGNVVLRRDHAVNVRLDGDGRNSTPVFGLDEIELIEVPVEAIDPDVATLRAAAAQARAEGQEHNGPSRKAMFNFAAMLMNEADKVESGDRGTLPPVLASARTWLDGAVNFDPAPVSETGNPIALLFFPESIPSAIPDMPPASTEPADWLIFSHEHSAWWKPARWGYTDLTSQAGKYTEAEAREICEKAAYRWKRGAGGPKALPPEVMVRADADDMFAAISEATREAVDAR